MFVSRGLVDPKTVPNRDGRKGSRLIFLHHHGRCAGVDASGYIVQRHRAVQVYKPPECRNGETGAKWRVGPVIGLRSIPGAHEKTPAVNRFVRTEN